MIIKPITILLDLFKTSKQYAFINHVHFISFKTIDAFPKFVNIIISFLKLRQEKFQLEQTLEQEQEFQVNKLMRKIERLEADVVAKQSCLEQVGERRTNLETFSPRIRYNYYNNFIIQPRLKIRFCVPDIITTHTT